MAHSIYRDPGRMAGHVRVLHSLAGSELNRQITQHKHAFTYSYTKHLHTRAKGSLTYGASKTNLGQRDRTLYVATIDLRRLQKYCGLPAGLFAQLRAVRRTFDKDVRVDLQTSTGRSAGRTSSLAALLMQLRATAT